MADENILDPTTLTAEQLTELMPYGRFIGITFTVATRALVEATLTWRPELCTPLGTIHGGAIMGFADSVGAACAFLNCTPDQTTTTIESKTNFMRAPTTSIRASCRPLSVGRRIIVVQTDLYDNGGKRVAQTTQTQTVQPLTG